MRKMTKIRGESGLLLIVVFAALLILPAAPAGAEVPGVAGSNFALTARQDYIITGDGAAVLLWGYADNAGRAQYPGPTLIVDQWSTVTITLRNELPLDAGNVSIVFPGQRVVASGGAAGLLTNEAPPDGTTTVTYTFLAANPGTFLYHSGTRAELQVEMGLIGALIVRPYGFNPTAPAAYGHPGSAFDREYLFFLSEMDPRIHDTVEFRGVAALGGYDFLSDYFPNYWFINGRTGPDTMGEGNPPGSGLLPTQPYNSMPMMHPGEKVLMRVVGAGRVLHPFHHHGNHARVIARDGKLLDTGTAAGWPDLSHEVFTVQSVPGQTVDAVFEWTGKGMGWDIYGTAPEHPHMCNGRSTDDAAALRSSNPGDTYFASQDPVTKEWCADHGKPVPVTLPGFGDLTMGPFFSGSPYLGVTEVLPPGQGGLNPTGAYVFMWHSHNEKELCNYGVFPGGQMTMMIIEPPGVPIP